VLISVLLVLGDEPSGLKEIVVKWNSFRLFVYPAQDGMLIAQSPIHQADRALAEWALSG
jgi:hypothetical protein